MNTKTKIASKSASEIIDEEKKRKEQKEREKEAERQRIQEQAEAIAVNFVRIGGVWHKKCINPDGDFVLEQTCAANITADYEKKLGTAILKAAMKCVNETNQPEHINYQEYIKTPSGDFYYNQYRPLKYKPKEGDFPHLNSLIRHIFGEQYELGMDYVQLIYTKPMLRLPVLVLVSTENNTGKSTFCKVISTIVGENSIAIDNKVLVSRFNSSWTHKIFVYNEEALEDPKLQEMFKNYATAEKLPTEGKGTNMANKKVYFKLVLCSNDEIHPTYINKQDTRHWVRKVPVIQDNPGKSFYEECKKEIPALLWHLQHRKLSTSGIDRLWFTPEETRTEAWQKIVAASRDSFEQSLIDFFLDTMNVYNVDELKYSKTELNNIVRNATQFSDSDRRKCSDSHIKEIMNKWGLKATTKTCHHKVYSLDYEGGEVMSLPYRSSNVYVITREVLSK